MRRSRPSTSASARDTPRGPASPRRTPAPTHADLARPRRRPQRSPVPLSLAAASPTSALLSLFLALFAFLLVLPDAASAEPQARPVSSAAAGGNNNQPAQGSSSAAASSSIPQTAAAGGITITQPAQTASASYYKIQQGINVTFGWNFTSVLSYPSALTVAAYNSDNKNTYTITNNLPGTATAVTWSPWQYQQQAAANNQPTLNVGTYRLLVYDNRGINTNSNLGGVFNPNTNVQFALYIPSKYTPISEGWICGSCNGVASLRSNPLLVALTATLVAVLVSGWNVLSRGAAGAGVGGAAAAARGPAALAQ